MLEYAIVGNGRLAKHVSHYFSLLQIPHRHWSRSDMVALSEAVDGCATVLLLISDGAIEDFIRANGCLTGKRLVHCSGCLVTDLAFGAHPLMTFGPILYALEDYRRIPWVLETDGFSFSELFPEFLNPHYTIPKAEKPYYHAQCVMANNFTTLLWDRFFKTLGRRYGIEKNDLMPIMERTLLNLQADAQTALTGPLVRRDQKTIQSNLQALEGQSSAPLYEAFVHWYERGAVDE